MCSCWKPSKSLPSQGSKRWKETSWFLLVSLSQYRIEARLGVAEVICLYWTFSWVWLLKRAGDSSSFPLEVNRSTSGPAVTPQRVTQRNCPQQGHCCMNFAWLNWWDSCYSHCYMLLVIFLSYVSRMRAKPWDKCCHIRHCQRALRFKGHRVNIDQKHQKLIVGKKYLLYLLLQIAGIDYKPRRRFLSWIWTIYGSDSFLISPYRQTAVFTHFPLFKTWSRNG